MKICKYYRPYQENDHICTTCKKYDDCYKKDLFEPLEEIKEQEAYKGRPHGRFIPSVEEEKPIWSADGICLNCPNARKFYTLEPLLDGEIVNDKNYCNFFRTKERIELERDRREVEYIMKKYACESREDNDWRFNIEANISFSIYFCDTAIVGYTFIIKKENGTSFNQVYFKSEESAQKCLDELLEKYGEERLKEIFGIKNA